MGMTEDGFWDLLRRAAERPVERERTEYVVAELQRLPARSAAEFRGWLAAARGLADSAGMRAAAGAVLGEPVSGDAFFAFHLWALSLGRRAVVRAAEDPDSLAEEPRVRALAGGWAPGAHPGWGSLVHAVADAVDCPAEDPVDIRDIPLQNGSSTRLPRLESLFGNGIRAARKESADPVVTVVW